MENNDLCAVCGKGGALLLCDGCPHSVHRKCVGLTTVPDEAWFCNSCVTWHEQAKAAVAATAKGARKRPRADEGESDMAGPMLRKLATGAKSETSLIMLLQQLELQLPFSTFVVVAAAVRKALRVSSVEGPVAPPPPPPALDSNGVEGAAGSVAPSTSSAEEAGVARIPARPGLAGTVIVRTISAACGDGGTAVLSALSAVAEHPTRGFAFTTMAWGQTCVACGRHRLLRTLCFYCGADHHLYNGGGTLPYFGDMSQYMSKLTARLADLPSATGDADTVLLSACLASAPYPIARPWVARALSSSIMPLRLRLSRRGFSYFRSCAQEKATLTQNGGDMMFLSQKLCQVTLGHHQEARAATRLFRSLSKRWMMAHRDMGNHVSEKVLQDGAEALHAMKQMHRMFEVARSGRSPCLDRYVEATLADSSPAPKRHEGDADGAGAGAGVPSEGSPTKSRPARLKRGGLMATPQLDDVPTTGNQLTVVSDSEDSDGEEDVTPPVPEVDGFSFDGTLAMLMHTAASTPLSEIIGFDPMQGRLPMSHVVYCTHCAEDSRNTPTMDTCVSCGFPLKSKIDYGCLTDALVWTYVFDDLGLPLLSVRGAESSFVSLDDVFVLLPLARAYQTIDQLGHNFFRLQSYFLTHFVYVMSEWGKYLLPPELFWEELDCIARSMKHAIVLKESEIVGEFLHCLRILQAPEREPPYDALFQEGLAFLVTAEAGHGQCGLWVPKSRKPYDRYHAAYCGIVGVLEMKEATVAAYNSKWFAPRG